jgi:hypothetical protein
MLAVQIYVLYIGLLSPSHKVSQRNCERGPHATSDDENDGEIHRDRT